MENVCCLPADTEAHSIPSQSPWIHISIETCCYFVATLLFPQAYSLLLTHLASRCLATDVSAVLFWLHISSVHASCHNIVAFCAITLCSLIGSYQHSTGTYCHHLQADISKDTFHCKVHYLLHHTKAYLHNFAWLTCYSVFYR
jgi:hypothetical protein